MDDFGGSPILGDLRRLRLGIRGEAQISDVSSMTLGQRNQLETSLPSARGTTHGMI